METLKKMLCIAFLILLKDSGNFKSDQQTKARVLLNTLLVFFTNMRFHLEKDVVLTVFLELLTKLWPEISIKLEMEED